MSGWETTTIGEVCEVIAGQSPKSTFYNKERKGVPFHQGKKEFGERYIRPATTWTEKVTRLADKGDILMSVRAPVGPVNFAIERLCIGRGLAAIKPGEEVEPDFLFNFLVYFEQNIIGNAGAVFNSINKSQIQAIEFPFPDLAEQKRIVSILDEAFSAIAKAKENAEKNLLSARELFESYLNRVFTQQGPDWQEKPLGELVDIKHGFAFKSKFFVDHSDHIVLTPGSFYEEGGFRDRGEKTKYYEGEIADGFIHEKGDFVVAMTEQAAGLLGSSLIVPESNKYLHNQRLGLVQPKPDVPWCNEFFAHAFNTRHFRGEVHRSASGVKVRHTSPKKMYVVTMAYPTSVVEQQEVAKRLDGVLALRRQLETIYTQKLANLDELKQSLLQKAFTGQLTSTLEEVGV